jgi:uncharacterized membrane protein
MANLVAIVYPDEHRAAEVMATLKRLSSVYLIDLEDSCYVTKDRDGKLKLHQQMELAQNGAFGGFFWGGMIGALFGFPLGGFLLGTLAGAVGGKLLDYGISDDFIRSLSDEMQPGSSAIFMLVRRVTVDEVGPEIGKFGGTFLHTSLTKDAEAKFQAMLDESSQIVPPRSVDG